MRFAFRHALLVQGARIDREMFVITLANGRNEMNAAAEAFAAYSYCLIA